MLDILFAGKTESSDAIYSLVNILNTKPITGFNNAGALDQDPNAATTNLMDIIGTVKSLPAGSEVLSLVHSVAPGPMLVEEVKSTLLESSTFKYLLGVAGDVVNEPTFGGDALGAVVGHLKSIPVLEPIVSEALSTAFSLPVVGEQLGLVTGLLHNLSLGGHLLDGTIPAGTDLASEQFDDRSGLDTVDVVVGFAKSLPVVGDVVEAVIPNIFPLGLGENGVAIASILHEVTPGFQVVNAVIGEEGLLTEVLALDDLLGDGDILGGLLGGLTGGSASSSGSTDASANVGLLGILNLGTDGLLGGLLG
ncbi:hypothetical protein [Thiomicrorhabdus sp.]|uniref:hypothetical protein n=1 Tax=Thiomicrorhabdus sp. TaxID=2039724 RepID=UPI0029C9A9B1|nr:hypothetical protein [Thiomicrorhabdus sp.]